jgi:hypothetical protein
MIDLNSTLRELITERAEVHATCPNDHDYRLDLRKLSALTTPFVRLDEVVLSKSWCPKCGELASSYTIRTIH